MKIGICAPSTAFTREDADRVAALAAVHFPDVELWFDPQCFIENGHFAGTDLERQTAFVDLANSCEVAMPARVIMALICS